jgi:ATP-dependent RNA helicase DDX5/DBP2
MAALPKFEKNFYREHPNVERMTEQEVIEFRTKNSITVQGKDIPRPIRTFEEASFPGTLYSNINFSRSTRILRSSSTVHYGLVN